MDQKDHCKSALESLCRAYNILKLDYRILPLESGFSLAIDVTRRSSKGHPETPYLDIMRYRSAMNLAQAVCIPYDLLLKTQKRPVCPQYCVEFFIGFETKSSDP